PARYVLGSAVRPRTEPPGEVRRLLQQLVRLLVVGLAVDLLDLLQAHGPAGLLERLSGLVNPETLRQPRRRAAPKPVPVLVGGLSAQVVPIPAVFQLLYLRHRDRKSVV